MNVYAGNLLLLLLYGILAVAAGKREEKDGGDTDKKVILARCTSRCLTLYITQLSAAFTSLQNDDILTWCGNKRRCSQKSLRNPHGSGAFRIHPRRGLSFLASFQPFLRTELDIHTPVSSRDSICDVSGELTPCLKPVCMQPCMGQWDVMSKQCHRKCENRHECTASCDFLKSLQAMKQGHCPPPHRASGFAAACVLSCSADTDCPGSKKCCANGCGLTCQVPVNRFKGVPLKPQSEFIMDEYLNRSIKVTWKTRFNISAEPILYILQRRWNYGIQPSEDLSTHWQTMTVTAAHYFVMTDIRPGRWYQFRVAAVNMHGTQGYTTPSKHVHCTRDPLPPTAPTGLRKYNPIVAHDGTTSINITWAVPPEHDLKIHHYRICWKIKNSGKREESCVLTDGANTEFALQGLLPDTEYLGKIQAVSYWGPKRMKSPKAEFIFSTAQQGLTPTSRTPVINPCNGRGKSYKSSTSTLRAFSFYRNNRLKIHLFWKQMSDNYVEPNTYLIKWRPVVCGNNGTFSEGKTVVKGSNYIITDLQFACTYKVTVRPFTLQRPLVEEVTFVKTPKCNNMKVKSLKDPHCPKQGSWPSQKMDIKKINCFTC